MFSIFSICFISFIYAKHGYDRSPIVPMRDYFENYRTLNGWECFEAQGKFCHHVNHTTMVLETGSSNFGHGICCKPQYHGEFCNNDGNHRCSQPASASDTSDSYKDILTDGRYNHQLFAFLPKNNASKCGIENDLISNYSMKLNTKPERQRISLIGNKSLQYKEGRPDVRRYDSCYYEISSARFRPRTESNSSQIFNFENEKTKVLNTTNLKNIVTILSLLNMNVYVYQGFTRDSATKSINDNK